MNTIDYAKKLVEEFGVTLEDAIKAMDTEADDIRNDPFQLGAGRFRKPTYKQALADAYANVRNWLANGSEYIVKLEYADLAQFAFSHRKACVWAVLTAKAKSAQPTPEQKALRGVLHHNAAVKEQYKLPDSLIREVEAALGVSDGNH